VPIALQIRELRRKTGDFTEKTLPHEAPGRAKDFNAISAGLTAQYALTGRVHWVAGFLYCELGRMPTY
jgi:hypothetical protein